MNGISRTRSPSLAALCCILTGMEMSATLRGLCFSLCAVFFHLSGTYNPYPDGETPSCCMTACCPQPRSPVSCLPPILISGCSQQSRRRDSFMLHDGVLPTAAVACQLPSTHPHLRLLRDPLRYDIIFLYYCSHLLIRLSNSPVTEVKPNNTNLQLTIQLTNK